MVSVTTDRDKSFLRHERRCAGEMWQEQTLVTLGLQPSPLVGLPENQNCDIADTHVPQNAWPGGGWIWYISHLSCTRQEA
jgi:hypothetical protein